MRALLENLRIRLETHLRSTSICDTSDGLHRALRQSAREILAIKHLAARHLDFEMFGQCIDH